MPARLEVARAASRDLADIRAWYSQPGAGQKAKNVVLEILNVIAALAEHPQLWQEVGDGVQEAIVTDHLIHYRANYTGPDRTGATIVRVLRIWHPGSNPPSRWQNPSPDAL